MFKRTLSYQLYGTRSMAAFQCIADRCEDSCCAGGLRVPLTWRELDKLRRAVPVRGGPEALEAGLEQSWQSGEKTYLSQGGSRCPFLAPTNLCSLVTSGQAEALPDVCHQFPRRFALLPGKGMRVVPSLACPEAARLSLLPEDGLRIQELPASVTEVYPDADVHQESVEPYVRHFEAVLDWGAERLLAGAVPLSGRLMALAELGARVDPFFHRGAPSAGGLLEALEASPPPEVLARAAPLEGLLPILFWLQTGLEGAVPRARDMVSSCLQWLSDAAGGSDPAAQAQAFLRACDRVPDLELWLGRYAAACWMEDGYTSAPSIGAAALRLAVRTAFVRFLLCTHPRLEADPAAALIEAVQVYSRHIERDGTVHRAIQRALDMQRVPADLLQRTRLFATLCA